MQLQFSALLVSSAPQPAEAPQENLQSRLLSNLDQLIQIRRVEGEGSSVDALLIRAEKAVQQGDFATAIGELKHLPETEGSRWQGWVEAAQASLNAPLHLQKLEEAMMAAGANVNQTAGE